MKILAHGKLYPNKWQVECEGCGCEFIVHGNRDPVYLAITVPYGIETSCGTELSRYIAQINCPECKMPHDLQNSELVEGDSV